jgi:proline iminopeptidase
MQTSPVQRSGTGPIALFLHGGPGMDDYLADLAELLDDRLEAIRYTQRGVPPGPVEGPFTVAQHVADALSVLDAQGVDRAIIVGHSWGGFLAGHLLATHPDRCAAIVSLDGLGWTGDGGWPAFDAHFDRSLPEPVARRLAEIDARLQAGAR